MTHQSIKEQLGKVYQLLSQKKLKDSFDALIQIMYENNLMQFKDALDELQMTYKYLLQYTIESANDPERQRVYDKLFVDTYRLSGEMEQLLFDKYSSQLPYSQRTVFQQIDLQSGIESFTTISSQYELACESGNNIIPNDLKFKYQQRMRELFMVFWMTHFYTDDHILESKKLIKSDSLQDYELALLVSGVTLSLWRCFDPKKFEVLFEMTNASSDLVRQRAYVGILIAIYLYNDRLSFFASIQARFSILSEDKSFIKSLENIILQLIRSKESEKIAKRMNEEIIPEMAKITPHMRDKLNIMLKDNDTKEEDDEERNPNWKDLLDEVPGLTDKMKEISEMQMEGADVFLGTFSMLKTFPFFNDIHNWLVPFTTSFPEVYEETHDEDNKVFIEAISRSHFLCNSDKYSFLLSMQQLPGEQKRQMSTAIGAEFDGMKEIEKDETSLNKSKSSEYISNQYVQDLYRLFNLHPRKTEFYNIFKTRLDIHNKKNIAKLIEDEKVWYNIAGYYFQKNYFEEAAELFDGFLEKEATNAEILQKRGYCAQKIGDINSALKYYLKADLVDSNNIWTVKKIAYCYRSIGDAENALAYYKIAIGLQPKNFSLQLYAGHCYLSMKQYDEALNMYFKIELESNKPQKVWRPIAWTSFICHKLDQAQRYYIKILAEKPTPHDYINAGHAELVANNNVLALEHYKQAVRGLNNDFDRFLEIFEDDKSYLLAYNVDKDDLPIFLDSLRYSLEY